MANNNNANYRAALLASMGNGVNNNANMQAAMLASMANNPAPPPLPAPLPLPLPVAPAAAHGAPNNNAAFHAAMAASRANANAREAAQLAAVVAESTVVANDALLADVIDDFHFADEQHQHAIISGLKLDDYLLANGRRNNPNYAQYHDLAERIIALGTLDRAVYAIPEHQAALATVQGDVDAILAGIDMPVFPIVERLLAMDASLDEEEEMQEYHRLEEAREQARRNELQRVRTEALVEAARVQREAEAEAARVAAARASANARARMIEAATRRAAAAAAAAAAKPSANGTPPNAVGKPPGGSGRRTSRRTSRRSKKRSSRKVRSTRRRN